MAAGAGAGSDFYSVPSSGVKTYIERETPLRLNSKNDISYSTDDSPFDKPKSKLYQATASQPSRVVKMLLM